MNHLREYELTYILAPDTSEDDKQRIAERVANTIGSFDGTIHRVDEWGKRTLSYPVRKHLRGIYIYLRFNASGDAVAELERILRLLDPVIKFLTVKLDKDAVEGVRPDAQEEEEEAPQQRRRPRREEPEDDEDEDEDDED